MIYKLVKIGNSVGVTIPKKLLKIMKLKQGEEVFMEPNLETRTIVIKPIEVAEDQVNAKVIEGMKKFTKKYPKALKNLAK